MICACASSAARNSLANSPITSIIGSTTRSGACCRNVDELLLALLVQVIHAASPRCRNESRDLKAA
jgi:hypothetical protein